MKLDQTKAFEPASTSESKGMGFANRVSEWSTQHPILAIMLISLLAVIINCYPVIFCGRSYVSPTCVGWLVYDWSPPLPGMNPARRVSQHGSDTAAMMLWGVPVGFIESRSLLEHGELPLWNRYSHAGDTLIGQNETMLGDPLQLIVILGRGSAGAWDVKFVVAKFLFCVGFGLLILRLLGSCQLSLIYAALAAYCGAFFFINNHLVFFVFCYVPWILLSALGWLDLRSRRHVCWGVVWLLVNFACFNAGHVEVAVVLIGGLNLTAFAYTLIRHRNVAGLTTVIGRMILGAILFLGLTAPMWMSFLAALDGAYSVHSEVRVVQLSIANLPGVFDDLFYLLLRMDDAYAAIAPGTSFLVLAGCSLSALNWRQLKEDLFFWVNTGAILLWSGCVFGWIPASVLAAVPWLNRVGHIYTDISYLLVIHLTIQSAYGFKCLAKERDFRRVAVDFLWTGFIFGGIFLAYCFGNTHRPIPWNYFLCAGAGGIGAPLLFTYLRSRSRPIPAIGWAGIVILGFIPHFRFGLYSFGNENLLMLPGPRVVLNAPSQAIDRIQADKSGPFRVVGFGLNFCGDYPAVYGIEDIRSCAPLSNGRYIDLIRKFPGVKFDRDWVIELTDLVAAQPLLNLLNVKYLLVQPNTQVDIEKGVGFRIADRSDFLVLENLQAWPRAFFTDKIVTNASTEEFIKQLWKSGKQPIVALSQDEMKKLPGLQPLEATKQATMVPATNYRLLPNSTTFDVRAPSAGVVCLTEGQARDFTVKANNERKEVLTVNCAFKGVYLDQPGDYHIEFVYRPHYWSLACTVFWISACGVIVLVSMSTFRFRFERKNRPHKNPKSS
jgi:hypothetical protein